MNVLEAIGKRHSYRGKFKSDPVPREDLIKIMQAGLDAPSGCNKQTTSLIAVDDQGILKKLHSVIEPPVGETAPAAICVLTQRINAYRDRCFSVQDYSAAIQNMLLAIVELGYQSCWYEGHITDEDKINEKMAAILNVPDGYELVCFLPVGIADDAPGLPKKKDFNERAWFNSFMGEIIAACGNDCSACPRYIAHPYEKTDEELKHTAELWMKIGYRDHLVTNEEISCTGCKPENWCRYHVVKCCEDKGISNCSECTDYPCQNMKECFEVTKSFEPMCKKVCTEEEYLQMKKAFFEKEQNLRRV